MDGKMKQICKNRGSYMKLIGEANGKSQKPMEKIEPTEGRKPTLIKKRIRRMLEEKKN